MEKISGTYGNIVQGVSQEPEYNRLVGRVEEQINMHSDMIKGVTRRPPLRYVAQLSRTRIPEGNLHVDSATWNLGEQVSLHTNKVSTWQPQFQWLKLARQGDTTNVMVVTMDDGHFRVFEASGYAYLSVGTATVKHPPISVVAFDTRVLALGTGQLGTNPVTLPEDSTTWNATSPKRVSIYLELLYRTNYTQYKVVVKSPSGAVYTMLYMQEDVKHTSAQIINLLRESAPAGLQPYLSVVGNKLVIFQPSLSTTWELQELSVGSLQSVVLFDVNKQLRDPTQLPSVFIDHGRVTMQPSFDKDSTYYLQFRSNGKAVGSTAYQHSPYLYHGTWEECGKGATRVSIDTYVSLNLTFATTTIRDAGRPYASPPTTSTGHRGFIGGTPSNYVGTLSNGADLWWRPRKVGYAQGDASISVKRRSSTTPALFGVQGGDPTANTPSVNWGRGESSHMCMFQGRLVIVSGRFLVFSEANEPDNLFVKTLTHAYAGMPFNLETPTKEVITAVHVYNSDLFVFTSTRQFKLSGKAPVSHVSILEELSTLPLIYKSIPVSGKDGMFMFGMSGRAGFRIAPPNAGTTYTHEGGLKVYYYYYNKKLERYDNIELTSHVPNLIPYMDMQAILYGKGEQGWEYYRPNLSAQMHEPTDTLYLVSGLASKQLYALTYKYEDGKVTQHAWYKYELPMYVHNLKIIEDKLLMVCSSGVGLEKDSYYFMELDLSTQKSDTLYADDCMFVWANDTDKGKELSYPLTEAGIASDLIHDVQYLTEWNGKWWSYKRKVVMNPRTGVNEYPLQHLWEASNGKYLMADNVEADISEIPEEDATFVRGRGTENERLCLKFPKAIRESGLRIPEDDTHIEAWTKLVLRYESSITPTTPYPRDAKGTAITNGRFLLKRIGVNVKKSGTWEAKVTKKAVAVQRTYGASVLGEEARSGIENQQLGYGGTALSTGKRKVSVGRVVGDLTIKLSTTDIYPLNITNIDWEGRFTQLSKRR